MQDEHKDQISKLEAANEKSAADLNKVISEKTEQVHAKEIEVKDAAQQIQSQKQIEDKLRQQIVETEKNQQASQSQLEANLTQKIK